MPIAGGEVLTRRQAFMPWLTRGAFDIVQPDVTKVGGISEQRRIAWMAHDFGVKYIGHGWNTALGVAADLQLASAFPDCRSRRVHRRQPLCRRHPGGAVQARLRWLPRDPRCARASASRSTPTSSRATRPMSRRCSNRCGACPAGLLHQRMSPRVRGSQSVIAGIKVIATSARSKGTSHGSIAIVVRSIESLATRERTKSTIPNGG